MSESQIRRICNLEVPTPIKVGNRYYLVGSYGNVEVTGPSIESKIDLARVKTFIRKQVKCITGELDSVDSLIEDINPRLYNRWWG